MISHRERSPIRTNTAWAYLSQTIESELMRSLSHGNIKNSEATPISFKIILENRNERYTNTLPERMIVTAYFRELKQYDNVVHGKIATVFLEHLNKLCEEAHAAKSNPLSSVMIVRSFFNKFIETNPVWKTFKVFPANLNETKA